MPLHEQKLFKEHSTASSFSCSLLWKDAPVSFAFSVSLALPCSPPHFLPSSVLLYSSDFSQCHYFPLSRRGMVSVYWRSRASLHGWTAGGSSKKKRNLHNFSASFHENYIAVYRSPPPDILFITRPSCLTRYRCGVPLLLTTALATGSFITHYIKQNVSHLKCIKALWKQGELFPWGSPTIEQHASLLISPSSEVPCSYFKQQPKTMLTLSFSLWWLSKI